MDTSIKDEVTNFLSEQKGIVINDFVFNQTYEPNIVYHREEEKFKILNFFRSAKDGICDSLEITGSPGTGKTLLIKAISEEFQKIFPNFKIIYIYCASANSETKALKSLALSMSNDIKVGRGSNEFIQKIKTSLNNLDGLILILDEIDKLLINDGDNMLLNLLNIPKVSLILISNEINWRSRITDDRVIQRLIPNNITFHPYTEDQLCEILRERAKKGLREGSYSTLTLYEIANIVCSSSNNTREAIKMLQRAAKYSEGKEESTISEEAVKYATTKQQDDGIVDFINHLHNTRQVCILAVYNYYLRNNEYPTAENVNERYNHLMRNSIPISLYTTQDYLRELLTSGVIEKTCGKGLGRGKGRTLERYKLKIDNNIYYDRIYSKKITTKSIFDK